MFPVPKGYFPDVLRTAFLAVAVTGVALVAAGPADAGSLPGYVKHLHVRVTTTPSGGASRVVFRDRAPCATGASFRDVNFVDPKGQQRYRAHGAYTTRDRGGIRARVRVSSWGRKDSIYRWHGRFAIHVTVRRHGRVVDHCAIRSKRWVAKVQNVHLEVTGEPGDYVTQGQSYSLNSVDDGFYVRNLHARDVFVTVGGFDVWFRAPPHQKFVAGRTYTEVVSYPLNSNQAYFDLEGLGRGCNQWGGQFTVTAAAADRHGILTSFAATFEEHCDGQTAPAVRGTFSLHRVR